MSSENGLNVRAIAKRWGCGIDQVRRLIAAGELRAINIGLGNQRARWVVSESEIKAFEQRRSNQQPVPRRRSPQITPKRQWV